MALTPETKKALLYGGGALASIAALILFLRSKQSAQPSYAVASPQGSGGVGAGGAASPLSAAQINAATAMSIEESRQQAALQAAALQSATAIQVANIQAGTARSVASSQAMGNVFRGAGAAASGPGGVGSVATKGLFDLIKDLFSPSQSTTSGPSILPETVFPPTEGYFPGANPNLNVIAPGEIYGPMPLSANESTVLYDAGGNMVTSPGPFADYYQGSSGGGDSSWFGDTTFNYGDLGSGLSESGGGITE